MGATTAAHPTGAPRMAAPRRLCPACVRRYAGLVAVDCPVCHGLGVLTLGAGALHHYPTAAVARAVDLFLEHAAQEAAAGLPLGDRRAFLEAATDELRVAGVLSSTADGSGHPARTPAPADAAAARVTELDAHRLARDLGRPPTPRVAAAIAARPDPTLPGVRVARTRGDVPAVSATGHPSALATICDPIDVLGPDVALLQSDRRNTDHTAAILAEATSEAAHRRRRKAQDPAARADGVAHGATRREGLS